MQVATSRVERPSSRVCAACGRENDPRREICATCPTDLETGLPLGGTPLRTDRAAPTRPAIRWAALRDRALLTAGGMLLVAASIAVLLTLLQVGPFAAPDRLERAVFLIAAYPGPATVVDVEAVATTTTVELPDRVVSPLNLFDGDTGSAWIGLPVDADGAGEVIELLLTEPAWVTRLEIRNGDHLSPAAYERSERLQRVLVRFDGGRDYRVDLLDIGLEGQVVELPAPELTTRVTIVVERTFAGLGPRGAALSEVTIVGWTASVSDAVLARQRAGTR
jgi:hypothetical protein